MTFREHKKVTIYGDASGYKTCAVTVHPDGSMTRADVRLDLSVKIKNISEAARIVGMSRENFIKVRDELRSNI